MSVQPSGSAGMPRLALTMRHGMHPAMAPRYAGLRHPDDPPPVPPSPPVSPPPPPVSPPPPPPPPVSPPPPPAPKKKDGEGEGDGTGKLFERLVDLQDRIEENLGTKLTEKLTSQLKGILDELVTEKVKSVESTLKGQSTQAANQLTETINSRLISSALRLAAEAAGAHDFDTLNAMVDKSAIKVGDDGVVSGVAEAITKLQAEKKFLFGEPKATSGTQKTPKPGDPAPKSAKTMSPEEWAAEKRRLGLR